MSFARFDASLILPTIEELVGLDSEDESRKITRIQTTGSVRRIPTAKAIVDGAAVRVTPRTAKTVVTLRRAPLSRKIAWPVFLCGFIAGITGGIAFMKSPVGHKPAVQRVMKQAEATVHAVGRH